MALREWIRRWRCAAASLALAFTSCQSARQNETIRSISPYSAAAASDASQSVPVQRVAGETVSAPTSLGLDDVIRLAMERNPKLSQAAFAIDAARGKADQAGRMPNPTVLVEGQELGDAMGPGGIWTAPFFSQEFVTAGKLRLARAAANREADQATLQLHAQRFALIGAVRQGYFDVLTLQRRAEILGELVQLAEKSVDNTRRLLEARQAARLDLLQMEVELERIRAERDATQRELPAAFRKLAAAAGEPDLPYRRLVGSLDAPLPDYSLEQTAAVVRENHPEAIAARVGVDKAQLQLRRAQVERVPNVTVGGGYMRQNQNRSDDWAISVSLPVPLWNRNQGNIRAAQAQVGESASEAVRVENDLVERLAMAHREYAAARQKADRYRVAILPRAKESYELLLEAFRRGQFDYLKVLQAQRAVAEANLEYVKSLGEAWKGASAISGLMLEEMWPLVPPPQQ
jgi:outer membrane protein, heavy metal efflux system